MILQTFIPRFISCFALAIWIMPAVSSLANKAELPPLGPIGSRATYIRESTTTSRNSSVHKLVISLGPMEARTAGSFQWLELDATKTGDGRFRVWVLASAFPRPAVPQNATNLTRYILQEGSAQPKEFVHRVTGEPVLPSTGAWEFLWPRPEAGDFRDGTIASRIAWLGQTYRLESSTRNASEFFLPEARRIELLPDVLVGVPSNSRTRDDQRRFDGSDYEMVRLRQDDYAEMIRAGMNCLRVDAEQAGWLADEPVFVWGMGGKDVPFPECLFRSTWIGPALFYDEPAVHTRDYLVRPRLAKEEEFRKAITPQIVFDQFTNYFHQTVAERTPWSLINGLRSRPDVDLGTMHFPQRNLYTWETMIASAVWQLTAETNGGPCAVVFEPPGRLGTRRTLPEMNMAYGCQLAPENPANLAGILFGFLRGAARAADRNWGVSIYGAVDRADAPWLLTHAYDRGATHFFFWDNYQLACVPYGEYLSLARHLQVHVRSHPTRNLARLKRAADVAILLPPGYNLGHTHMGRGNLWGLGELNLERKNRQGVSYRTVMGHFFTEIERCLRLGIAFDLLWDLDRLNLNGYREVVRVCEDGRVEITADGQRTSLSNPRLPGRPPGYPPKLTVELSTQGDVSSPSFIASAHLTEGSSPVYYTTGTDRNGIYQNVMVLWELYGPGEEDYRTLSGRVRQPEVDGTGRTIVETEFKLEKPGPYRLRAATADLAGRSAVVWKEFKVGP